jgi:hypothetical protein
MMIWRAFVKGFWRGYRSSRPSAKPKTLVIYLDADTAYVVRNVKLYEDALDYCTRHRLVPIRYH